ncbi:hypothetical protein [Tepidibacter aestuarii]|uniref:hypothetical protein n=1 Tax=Tepidibacter aestuarii TaxID=2925782 RepID=UPI0020BDBE8B|nr:hypothetical protein [Tepidibacter aestuarii]CAH2213275.1 conserved protein of unknown function [Tepidibacter aestuarii]
MEKEFLQKELEVLFQEADKIDQKTLKIYNRMIGNPITIEEFLQKTKEGLGKKGSQFITCIKMIEKLRKEEFFPLMIELASASINSIQVQTIFKSTGCIPKNIEKLRSSMTVIVNKMEEQKDTEVLFHGGCLLYRIVTKCPELENELENLRVYISDKELQDILIKFQNIERWETINHRGKSKQGYLKNEKDFLNFAMKFMKIR